MATLDNLGSALQTFLAANAQKPQAYGPAFWSLLTGLGSLSRRAIESAGSLQRGGSYDPGPALEAAGLVVGTPGVPRNALGSSLSDPLFHGSPTAGLTRLEPSTRGPLGPGVYTSPAQGIAKSYAWEGGPVYQLPEKTRDIYRGHGHRTDAEWYGFKEDKARLLAAAEPGKREELSKILDKAWSSDGYYAYGEIRRLYNGDEGAQQLFKRAGFEGISGLVDGPEVLLFKPQDLMDKRIDDYIAKRYPGRS